MWQPPLARGEAAAALPQASSAPPVMHVSLGVMAPRPCRHPCGRQPERIVNVMKSYISNRRLYYQGTGCLTGTPAPTPPGTWLAPIPVATMPFKHAITVGCPGAAQCVQAAAVVGAVALACRCSMRCACGC